MPAFCTRCHKRATQCTCAPRSPAPFRRYLGEPGTPRTVERRELVIPYALRRPPLTRVQCLYARALSTGARAMCAAAFGGLTDSLEPTKHCRFNRELWRRVQDGDAEPDEGGQPYKLVLRRGTPAAAMANLFSNLADWSFDCGEAIQLLRWNAQREALGDGAFNRKIALLGAGFELKEHDSTGLTSSHVYLRVDGEGDYDKNVGFRLEALDEEVAASTATLLASAPIGSRVMWRNFHNEVDDDDPFKNENAIKLGDDSYFAHPMGFRDERRLVRELAQTADSSLDDEAADRYAERHIRIVDIEYCSDV